MANALHQSARLCDAGLHKMDPNWDTCPYCDAAERSKERTQVREQTAPPEVHAAPSGQRSTRVGPSTPAPRGRETKVMPGEAASRSGGDQVGEADTRRVMGFVITYTWRPEGQYFPIREGKNFIGAGAISSETTHRECEIQITEDARLSAEHALILCRHGRYELVDQKSSNGTFLNDEMVPIQGIELKENYEQIQTGSTVWTFIKVEAPPATATAPQPEARRTEPKQEPRSEPEPVQAPSTNKDTTVW